ncbi:MAG: bifunctional 5,10-methylenetetrahydrofolate dehydrogenase/5,10-methenyltetrahydrofolate cyclohydrolase [Chloroflexi bacterium]|nr:bifunctional 5,10-methylenetetrahydrofolate dehydrogenase/5,10-methenyltetrahydrofolate cyclohydrolase [Chloroflexota bacterium]
MPRRLAAQPFAKQITARASEIAARAIAAAHGRSPEIAVVIATSEPDSLLYVDRLLKQVSATGLAGRRVDLGATASEAEILAALAALSSDRNVAGIILQSPLPSGVSREIVAAAIAPGKDIDGITHQNAERLADGTHDDSLLPATAAAVMELLRAYEVPLSGRPAVVVGRSAIVGRPVAHLLELAGAHVEVAHSKTPDLGVVTRPAEVLVVAAGVRGLVRGEHVSPGAVVIDVGIHPSGDTIVGDVDAESVEAVLGASGGLSPVPGGVGPMTSAVLALHAAQAAERLVRERA